MGLADGVSFGQQVQAFVESDEANREQVETLVRSAVRNLCPEHSGLVPVRRALAIAALLLIGMAAGVFGMGSQRPRLDY